MLPSIDEMGASDFYDRYYDAVNYMDVNAGYTFGKQFKTTFYVEATNLLNQPLRYYQGTKERTMQSEHYGVRVNAGQGWAAIARKGHFSY